MLRDSAAVFQRVFGVDGLQYAQGLNSLAIALEWQGRVTEALPLVENSIAIARPQLGNSHPRVQNLIVNRARLLIARGEGAQTEAELTEVLRAREALYPAGDWRIAQSQSLLGAALMAQRRYTEAERLMVAADDGLRPIQGMQARERAANRARLAIVRGRLHDADPMASRGVARSRG
jgi:tetratricopeptide (TPR) repeat protein